MDSHELLPLPVTQDSVVGPEVVGIDPDHGVDIDVETVPKTSFGEIVTRGGNNPDGKFSNFLSVD
jgi:hypothetical protein